MDKRTLVLDLEFVNVRKANRSKFEHLRHEIIEIGAVILDDDMNVIGQFQEYIKPQFSSVSKMVTRLTGITNDILADKNDFTNVFQRFLDWIDCWKGDLRVYSWSLTDLEVMRNEVSEKLSDISGEEILFDNWYDAQREFSDGLCYNQVLSLSTAISAIDADFSGMVHSALADAANTAKLVALMSQPELFAKRTEPIRSLFVEKEEDMGNTLGAMFAECFGSIQYA